MRIRFLRATTLVEKYAANEEVDMSSSDARQFIAEGIAVLVLDDVAPVETARDASIETATEDRR
jgi:hypothetical protein